MVSSYEMWGGLSFQFYGVGTLPATGGRFPTPLSHGDIMCALQTYPLPWRRKRLLYKKKGLPLFYFIFLIVMEYILTGEGCGFVSTGEGCGFVSTHYVRGAVSDFANSTVTWFPQMDKPVVESVRKARADCAAVSYLMIANPRMVP